MIGDRVDARAAAALMLLSFSLACGPLPDEGAGDGYQVAGAELVGSANQSPSWLLSVRGAGTWTEAADKARGREVVRGWVDGRVLNRRFHKRVFVEVAAPYGKAVLRTLHPAWYKGNLGGGYEKWGTDTVEIYPTGGPSGAALSGAVVCRLRMQEDPDGDGQDQMVVTPWRPLYGAGKGPDLSADPFGPALNSPTRPVAKSSPPQAFFTPFDDAGREVMRQIDSIIQAKKADPAGRHTLHAAIFNINDSRTVDRVIAAHRAGVEVRLITEADKLRPWATWQTEDDRLLKAGVPLLAVQRRGNGAMHMKLALFDGARAATGSFNWQVGSRVENHENMLLFDAPDLVGAYAARFVALAGGVQRSRTLANNPSATRSVGFTPDEKPYRVMGQLIDGAKATIHVAMFTAKDIKYTDAQGRRTSLHAKLAAAVKRGVEVILVTDYGIAEAHEYYGQMSKDDPNDEWLAARGVHVVLADNRMGAYASMHHKFVVIDSAVVVTGALNWYHDAAYLNDEDQLVWRDKTLAARYTGELTDLLRRYDPAFKPSAWPQVKVRFEIKHANTAWGDAVAITGDLPQLGSWNPHKGLRLDASAWPTWRGTLSLPAGVRGQFKAVTLRSGGKVSWQHGGNRKFEVPTDGTALVVKGNF